MRPFWFTSALIWLAAGTLAGAAEPAVQPSALSKDDVEFFEKSIRPVLVEKCYRCHSGEAKVLEGGLLLDSRQGIAAGGDNGPVLAERDPDKSRLIQAIRWTDAD